MPLKLCPAHMLTTSEATSHSLQRLINVCLSSCGCRSGSNLFILVEIVLRLVFLAFSKSMNGKNFLACGVNGILRSTYSVQAALYLFRIEATCRLLSLCSQVQTFSSRRVEVRAAHQCLRLPYETCNSLQALFPRRLRVPDLSLSDS